MQVPPQQLFRVPLVHSAEEVQAPVSGALVVGALVVVVVVVVVVTLVGHVMVVLVQCSGGTFLPSQSSDKAIVPAHCGPPGGLGQSSYFMHSAGSGTPRQMPSQPKQQRGLRSQAPFSAPAAHVGR